MISNHEAELIAQIDAKSLKEDCKDYVGSNLFQYYTLVNTWTSLLSGHNPVAADILEKMILNRGLLSTIKAASETADAIIREQMIDLPEFCLITKGLDTADALQVLRFPKRFTPVSKGLESQTLTAFKQQLNKVRGINMRRRGTGNRYFIEAVRLELNELFRYYEPADFSDIKLTNGVSRYSDDFSSGLGEGSFQYGNEKIRIGLNRPNFYNSPLYPSWYYPSIKYTNGNADYGLVFGLGETARVSTVPKSYKTYRTIAVETVEKQSDQQCVRAALEKALDKSVGLHAPIHNQGINGLLASNLNYATIDLHAASDSLSWWLMHEILPRPVYADCAFARSYYLIMPNTGRVINPLFCTMGNGFCFALETAVFLAISRAAVKCYCNFTGLAWNDDYVYAYGDDIIVLAEAYATVVDWLQALDFIVNNDKSFSTPSPFRESCGYDWFDSQSVTSIYWPRAVIKRDIESCASLCALEARIFQRGAGTFYYSAYSFLVKQVKLIAPNLSEVPIDVFLEYNLEGKALVTLTAPRLESTRYVREWSLVKGDAKSYEEDRLYCNLLHVLKDTSLDYSPIENYLYATFLRNGPKYDDELSRLLGVSTSYHDDQLRSKAGKTVVTRKRLF